MNDGATDRRSALTSGPLYGVGSGKSSGGQLFNGAGRGGDAPTRRDAVRFLFRHLLVITLCTLIVAAGVATGMYLLPPTYETSARILVKTDGRAGPTFFGGSAAFRDVGFPVSTAAVLETEMQLLLALPLSDSVARELNLVPDQLYRSPLAHFSAPLVSAYGWFREELLGREPGVPDEQRMVAEGLRRSITVTPVPSMTGESISSVIQVSLRAADPVVARDALAALLTHYLQGRGESDAAAGRTAARILEREVAMVEEELSENELSLRDFVARQGASGRPGPLTVARVDAAVSEQRSQLARLEMTLSETRQRYIESSEPVSKLLGEISVLRRQIASDVTTGAMADARYGELARAVMAAEQRHSELEQRLVEAHLFEAVMVEPLGDRAIVEPPLMPDGSDWKKRFILAVFGAVAGFCLGLALAGLKELTDSRVRSKDEVLRHFGLPVLAALPRRDAGVDQSVLVAAARGLGARLATSRAGSAPMLGGRGRIVLVTSAHHGDGKSTVATMLAEQLAEQGHGRVLLVRGSGAPEGASRPSVTAAPRHGRLLGQPVASDAATEPGLTMEALLDPGGAEGAVGAITPTVLDLSNGAGQVLTARALAHETIAPAGGRLGALLSQVANRYDWTIVDSGVSGDGNVLITALFADVAVLVVDASTTRRAVVDDMLRSLPVQADAAVTVVLNRASREIPGYLYDRL